MFLSHVEEKELSLVLSSMLHDIEKFYRRAGKEKEFSREEDPDGANGHAMRSARIAKHILRLAEFPENVVSNVFKLISRHHSKNKVSFGDKVAANDERGEYEDTKNFEIPFTDKKGFWGVVNPLSLVIPNVREGTLVKNICFSNLYFRNPLEGWKLTFLKPSRLSELSHEDITVSDPYQYKEQAWEKLVNDFEKEIKLLRKEHRVLKKSSMLYNLLEDYFSTLPSSYGRVEKGTTTWVWSPVSLFDHSRIVAAINICNERTKKDESKFAIIVGDVSGIQKFIFPERMHSKSSLKLVKGRSILIQLYTLLSALSVLEALKLPLCNLIYVGGGSFAILGYDNGRLNKLLEEISHKFSKTFEGNLLLFFGVKKFRENLKNTYDGAWEDLEITKFKSRWKLVKNYIGSTSNQRPCKYCGIFSSVEKTEEEMPICKWCKKTFKEWKLFKKISESEKVFLNMDLKSFECHFSEKQEGISFSVNLFDISAMGTLQIPAVFPIFDEKNELSRVLLDHSLDNEPLRKGEIIPLNYASSRWFEGKKRYGVLKGDVDNLGHILKTGLQEVWSLSAIATLSRMISLFFERKIPKLCSDILRSENPRYIYLVYSGGDDFLVFGDPEALLKLSEKIIENFHIFSGWNPHVSLSLAFDVFPYKFPVSKAVEHTESNLNEIKSYFGPPVDEPIKMLLENVESSNSADKDIIEKTFSDQRVKSIAENKSSKIKICTLRHYLENEIKLLNNNDPRVLHGVIYSSKRWLSLMGAPLRLKASQTSVSEYDETKEIIKELKALEKNRKLDNPKVFLYKTLRILEPFAHDKTKKLESIAQLNYYFNRSKLVGSQVVKKLDLLNRKDIGHRLLRIFQASLRLELLEVSV